MRRIVLISCVSKKLQHTALAKDLYISPLFKLNMKYANQLQPDDIFILSAKYGLLALNEEISPYEKTLNTMKVAEIKNWATSVIEELADVCTIEKTEFIFLAGAKYRKFLIPHLKSYKIPLEGLGLGYQLQKLKELTA